MLCLGASALFYFCFDALQVDIREKAHEELHTASHLEVLHMSLEEFKITRSGDELWVDGKLYDVSHFEIDGDFVSVTVFHDSKEEQLVEHFAEDIEGSEHISACNVIHISRLRVHPPDDQKIIFRHPYTHSFIPEVQPVFNLYVHPVLTRTLFPVLNPPPEVIPA